MSLLIEQLRQSYRQPDGGRVNILDIEQYELASGEQAVLLGSSGCGKTTLLNVIAGLRTPDSGRVLIDGVDVTSLSEPARDRFRAERIGFIFQTFNLLPAFTALENVLLGMAFGRGGVDKTRAKELLGRVGLSHRLNNKPGALSVGERQRVAVARALSNQPKLMLADEPTANVDAANQQNLLDLIREACREHGISLLMVTHSPRVAEQFDRVDELSAFNRAAASHLAIS